MSRGEVRAWQRDVEGHDGAALGGPLHRAAREERWRREVAEAARRKAAQVDRRELLRVEGEAEVDRALVAAAYPPSPVAALGELGGRAVGGGGGDAEDVARRGLERRHHLVRVRLRVRARVSVSVRVRVTVRARVRICG